MQIAAAMLFWGVVLLFAGMVVAISLVMSLIRSLQPIAHPLRRATMHALPAALFLQVLGFLPSLVLFPVTFLVQWAARQFGANHEASLWVGVPILLVALAVPALATLAGGYVGFRVGWLKAKGEDPEVALSRDLVAGYLSPLGGASPVRW
jgi:hypothetical protein